jgi:membrane-associated phospholipid phosphatase
MVNDGYNLKERWLLSALLAFVLTLFCVLFIDLPVALFVKTYLYSNSRWSQLTSNLPDLLSVVVVLATAAGLWTYLVRSRRGIYDHMTSLAKVITWSAPVSYATKHFLKYVFGRCNTRRWVVEPAEYGFYWFQRRPSCDGFPSGHMVVMVTLLAALWRFYPRTRPYCVAAASVLAVALVVTNYHFVSDVLAGAYLGVAIEALAFHLLIREPYKLPGPSCSLS